MCSKCYCNMLESEKSPDITCHWQGPKSYYASLISLLIYMSCKLHEFHIRCSQICCLQNLLHQHTLHFIFTTSILLLNRYCYWVNCPCSCHMCCCETNTLLVVTTIRSAQTVFEHGVPSERLPT